MALRPANVNLFIRSAPIEESAIHIPQCTEIEYKMLTSLQMLLPRRSGIY